LRKRKVKFDLINADTSAKKDALAIIDIDDKGNSVIEIIIEPDFRKTFTNTDFFTALCELRKWLYEWKNYYPMLNGALKNVYPSRMSRQMSRGIMGYYLTLGKQGQEEDLLDIFHKVKKRDVKNLSTVEEQKEYYIGWLKSL